MNPPQRVTPPLSPARDGLGGDGREANAGPRPVAQPAAIDPQVASLSMLLKIEADARRASSERELLQLIANETRSLVRARQVFVLGRGIGRDRLQVRCVSSLAMVDRQVPLIQWTEALIRRLAKSGGSARTQSFALPTYADPTDATTTSYPFPHMLWVPLWSREADAADGVLLSRETPWLEADQRIAQRLADTFGHALALLRSRRPSVPNRRRRNTVRAVGMAGLVALGFLPVPITVLAPLEVTPRNPHIVAMPVEGIVQRVTIEPNAQVTTGQVLVQLVDTVARNKLEIAAREVAVAEARLEQSSSLSFSDAKGRHEVGIARAELQLRRAERDFAHDTLDKTTIKAEASGTAVFADAKDIEGRPLGVGERLMQIARPGEIEFRIDLPVADSIALQPRAHVRAFLDSDPLHAVDAEISHVDYQARLSDANVAAYRVIARMTEPGREPPRFGTRGTAQLEGPRGTLALLLLRRPFSYVRQRIGL